MRRVRFLAIFIGSLVVLETLLLVEPIDAHMIRPFSAGVAAVAGAVLGLLGEHVRTTGTMISGGCLAIDIHNGCNGVEVMLFVAAAILAFPASWRQRSIAAIAGAVLLQVANLIRVVSLYLIGCHRPAWFDTFHLAVWQSAMFALAVGYFLVWSRQARPVHAA